MILRVDFLIFTVLTVEDKLDPQITKALVFELCLELVEKHFL